MATAFIGNISGSTKAFAQWLLAALEKNDGTWCAIDQWQMDMDYENMSPHPRIRLEMTLSTPDSQGLHRAIMGRYDGPELTVAEPTEEIENQRPTDVAERHRIHRSRRAQEALDSQRIQEAIDNAVQAALAACEQQRNNRTLREKMMEILTQEGVVCARDIELDISMDTDLDTKEVKAIRVRRKVKW